MRWSNLFLPIQERVTHEVEAISHKLMIKAGLVYPIAAGIYAYLPLGWRILEKIINLVREEMNKIGGQELLLTCLQPKAIWELTGRWDGYGPEMFKLKDRKAADLGLAPTHEEPITKIVADKIRSYKNLPLLLYQIQTKFRDEPRARFGTLRAREFIMKDAYSFHSSLEDCEDMYKRVYKAYERIFSRCDLDFVALEAEAGIIGGELSHEFLSYANWGEDIILKCNHCDYKAIPAYAACGDNYPCLEEEELPLKLVETPDKKSVKEVSAYLNVPVEKLAKSLIFKGKKENKANFYCIMVSGEEELNFNKAKKALDLDNIELADEAEIEGLTGAPVGFAGPIGLDLPIYASYALKKRKNLVIGANKENYHYINANFGRDVKVNGFIDVSLAKEKSPCPKCNSPLHEEKAIEIGHTFLLGTRYSEPIKANILNERGELAPIIMGCYGIGITRLLPAIIEQHHDDKGIIFPPQVAPFSVIIIIPDTSKQDKMDLAFKLERQLEEKGVEVLLDERTDVSPGKKFYDADLLGIPLQIIIGKKTNEDNIELCYRKDKKRVYLRQAELFRFIVDQGEIK